MTGTAEVSHLHGCRITLLFLAFASFQPCTAFSTASRASGTSEGEAIITRNTVAT